VGLALVVTASGASAPAVSSTAPNAVPDQRNSFRQAPCRFTGWSPDDASSWAAQTFTAGLTGTLTDVVLRLRVVNPQLGLVITPVDASDQPVLASPLTSTIVTLTPNSTYADIAISFASPARVEAGKHYALVLLVPTATPQRYVAWGADFGSSVRDSTGAACADGAYPGGRAWGKGSDPPAPDADYFFQTFAVPAKHVTVQKSGTGSGTVTDSTGTLHCGATCTADLSVGQTVTLTAIPAAGSSFSGWSGACTGSSPTCSLTVSADTTVTAIFVKKLVALVVRKSGNGSVSSRPAGVACGSRCRFAFAPGVVTLIARAAAGWHFVRWQGACRGTKPLCRLRLAGAAAVTAVFRR
jgi:hypothetical protein